MKSRTLCAVIFLVATSIVLVAQSTARAEVNLIQNPGFEDGVLTPWIGSEWTLTSSDKRSGTYSAENTSGHTIRQFIQPVDVSDVLEVSLWVRSVDEVMHPVQLLYSESGGDWDEFPLHHLDPYWGFWDLTGNLRSSGTLYGILVFGGGGHTVRIDDVRIMVDDAVTAESTLWSSLKALYR
jgi:hypothetical protein